MRQYLGWAVAALVAAAFVVSVSAAPKAPPATPQHLIVPSPAQFATLFCGQTQDLLTADFTPAGEGTITALFAAWGRGVVTLQVGAATTTLPINSPTVQDYSLPLSGLLLTSRVAIAVTGQAGGCYPALAVPPWPLEVHSLQIDSGP